MNCGNCGAPMELFERRRYFFCRHCGSFHFIDTEVAEGVQVLGRGEAPDPCPVCAATLAKALLDGVHTVEYCEQCRGVLLSRGSFVDVTTTRRAFADGPPALPLPLDQRELQRQVTCPRCRTTMDVHPYYGPGNIVIDTCSRCSVIWLDCGELQQITEAPGKDRGRRFAAEPKIAEPLSDARGRSGGARPHASNELVGLLADLFSSD